MSYQVLARKWRPQIFSDVVGQEHVLTVLANGLVLGRVHHAYLLSGTRGVGKTTIARLLAKGLNCETGITATPCGQCANCLEIEQGSFVDLLEIDAASRTKVEDTREILNHIQYAPARGRFKMYLIDEVHMLSRNSFNALLKTLEEPPDHIKFLLATTEPKKLPATILSRCLQCHLKAIDVEQICKHLAKVLQKEQIAAEPRALKLLARAADGSMRDALSLTDQAIAMGKVGVITDAVKMMLGMLNTEQPLALLEALAAADGGSMMAQLAQCATHGMDWESLLVEMLSLLHRIAMGQLQPDQLEDDEELLEDDEELHVLQRLRDLARRLPPDDLQLYYQILLLGRKELPYAPDRRMGVEMTLLRALAFHPAGKFSSTAARVEKKTDDFGVDISFSAPELNSGAMLSCGQKACFDEEKPSPQVSEAADPLSSHASASDASSTDVVLWEGNIATTSSVHHPTGYATLPDATSQLLLARRALLCRQKKIKTKRNEQVPALKKPAIRWKTTPKIIRKEIWHAIQQPESVPVTTSKALHTAQEQLEHEKTLKLTSFYLSQESFRTDPWQAQIHRLALPKLVQQLALNTWKEELAPNKVCLHFRSSKKYLNSAFAQRVLREAIGADLGETIELTITEDNDSERKTPLEWHQMIYEKKWMKAKKLMINDSHIQMIQRLFDAELDDDSIRPVYPS